MNPCKIVFGCFLLMPWLAMGQPYMNKDSLLNVEKTAQDDTLKVQLYISLGQQYEGNHPDSALYYYEKALNLSRSLDYTRGIISYYTNATYVYNMLGRADTSLILTQQAVHIAMDYGDKERLASCLNNLGSSYYYLQAYDSAMKYMLQAGELLDSIGLKLRGGTIYANLAGICANIGYSDKGVEYFNMAEIIAREIKDDAMLVMAIANGSGAMNDLGMYQDAIRYLTEAIGICRKRQDNFSMQVLLVNIGDALMKMQKYQEALPYFEEGLLLSETLGDGANQVIELRGISYCLLDSKQLDKAMEYVKKSIVISKDLGLKSELEKNYLHLANVALAMGDLKTFYEYSYKHDSVLTILDRERLQENLEKLEQQYKAKQREQQIALLEEQSIANKLRYRTNVFVLVTVLGVSVSFLIVTLLFLRTNKQKRVILQQENEIKSSRINELEKEKQLLASEAVMKGQEEERKRLARDLHDGLGGMLSGIKFSFSHMKENIIMTPENQRGFERGMDMLDSSIRELRRVAHNLMPESLIKFGLNTSLNDMCKEITASGALRITYQAFDLDKLQTDQSVLIVIYRLVQELLNNVMKHAGATNTLVQLIYSERKLSVTVEDDGKGMDLNTLHLAQGIGWSNIKSRVEYLKGTWDIQSEPGKGTTVSIELVL